MTIKREDMFEPLLVACPTFRPTYEEFLEEWALEVDKPYYLALADFTRHIVGELEAGRTEQFPAIFAVVERWLLEGDSYVAEAATVGLLEDMQNHNLHPNGTKPEQFIPFLGDEARYWWAKVDAFWSKRDLIRDDRTRH